MDPIIEERRSLKRQMHETAARVKKLRRLAREEEAQRVQRETGDYRMPPTMHSFVLILYLIANYNVAIPVRYSRTRLRRPIFPVDASDEDRARAIEELFLQKDFDYLDHLLQSELPRERRRMRLAWKIYLECQVVLWVQDMNYSKGVAPRTKTIIEKLSEFGSSLCAHGYDVPSRDVQEGGDRKTMSLWRRRWRGHIGKIKKREPVDTIEMQSKALLGGGDIHVSGSPSCS